MRQWADWSAESGAGFPRDAPGPFHFLGLSELAEAASVLESDVKSAYRMSICDPGSLTFCNGTQREAERRGRLAELAGLT